MEGYELCNHTLDQVLVDVDDTKVYKKQLYSPSTDGYFYDYQVTDLSDNPLVFNQTYGQLFLYAKHIKYDSYPLVGQMKLLFDTSLTVNDWLLCDGRELLIADHNALYTKFGSSYNTESTTEGYFNLPLATGPITGYNYYVYKG